MAETLSAGPGLQLLQNALATWLFPDIDQVADQVVVRTRPTELVAMGELVVPAGWDVRLSLAARCWLILKPVTSTNLRTISLESRAGTFGALSDPIRLSILDRLGRDQCCVCELQGALDIAPNLLSYHLRILREAGLVEATRRGRWVDYRLADDAVAMVTAALPAPLHETVSR